MFRRTKIVATLGPATDNPDAMERLIAAGVDVVRINFSHGSLEEHKARVDLVRNLADKLGRTVAVLGDLQGPKIRVAKFVDGKVFLKEGDRFCLDAEQARETGDQNSVGIDYKELPDDVGPGDVLLLDDGRIVMKVDQVDGRKVRCIVTTGGFLSNNKGINRQGGGLSADALTDKDKRDILTAAAIDVDYVAVSFPRSAEDINYARSLVRAAGSDAGIVAKVERAESIAVIDEIILASDCVMVARGDLGVEIGDAALPGVQKHMISRARTLDRTVITATQMMESMIENSIPTRAEVFDVANAVLDGTDAVMLSAETAVGKDPANVVRSMSRVCVGAEQEVATKVSKHRINKTFQRADEAIAMATMYTANHLGVKAIIALTESGGTPLWMSRIRSALPVFALTRNVKTARKMALYRGVHPVLFDVVGVSPSEINTLAINQLVEAGYLAQDDLVILTKGDAMGVHGGTNMMKILRVGDVVKTVDP